MKDPGHSLPTIIRQVRGGQQLTLNPQDTLSLTVSHPRLVSAASAHF